MESFDIKRIKNNDFEEIYNKLSLEHNPIKSGLSQEYLTLLGEFNVLFQRLQGSISRFVYLTVGIGDNRFGEIITVNISERKLLDVLESLHIFLDSNDDKLKILLREARTALDIRNTIIHSRWVTGGSKTSVLRLKTKTRENKGVLFDFEEFTLDDLKLINIWIDKLYISFDALQFEFIKKQATAMPEN